MGASSKTVIGFGGAHWTMPMFQRLYTARTGPIMAHPDSIPYPAMNYVIGHITVKDPAKWAEYRAQVPATLAPWQAELVFRGERLAVLGGTHAHSDTVVIRFPNAEAVEGWFNSAAYQALIPLRLAAADVDLISYAAG